ncbi:MAG: hypothetical protein ACRERD_28010 [Candidatus Binatia bacterium]
MICQCNHTYQQGPTTCTPTAVVLRSIKQEIGDLFPGSSGVTRLDSTTTPSTHANNGTPTGVALSQISETGGVVKVRVKV